MARIVKDRVKDTSTTTGTGTITLANSPPNGFQAFSVLGNGSTTFYCIEDANGTAFEVGVGTYTGNTLARTTILESSNSDNAISLTSGTHTAFVTYPSNRSTFNDEGLSPTFTASGTVTAGKPVIQNTNGTVTQVAESTTGVITEAITTAVNSNNPANKSLTATDGNGTIVQFYTGTSGNPTIQAGTISGTSITWGTAVITQTQDTQGFFLYYDPQGYFVTGSRNGDNGNQIKCFTYSVSGTALTQVSINTLIYSETGHENLIGGYHKQAQKGLLVSILSSGTNRTFMNTLTVASNGSMTFGTTATDTYRVYSTPQLVYNDEQKCLMLYASAVVPSGGGDWYQPSVMCFTISGSTPSMGTPVQIATSGQTGEYGYLIYHAESKKTLAFYEYYNGSDEVINYQVVGISGTTVTAGTSTYVGFAGRISNAIVEYTNIGVYEPFTKKIGIAYVDGTNGTTLRIRSATLTNDTLTFDGEVTPGIAPAYNVSMLNLNSSDSKTFLIGSQSNSQTKYNVWTIGSAGVTASNLTPTNFFGVASNSATTTNPVQINVNGSINNAQTGLTVDKDYYVTDAGLIKERTTTTTTTDTTPSSTDFITYASSQIGNGIKTSIAYDTTNDKIGVLNYGAGGADYYPRLTIGTESGGSITWGTPVIVYSGNGGNERGYQLTYGNGAFIGTYATSSKGYVFGATYTGTNSATIGTRVQPFSGDLYRENCTISYNPNENKFVFIAKELNTTDFKLYIITNSGTTLTVGNSATLSVTANTYSHWFNGYDPDTHRTVIAISYVVGSGNDKIYTANISGSNITASSNYLSVGYANFSEGNQSMNYDPDNNKWLYLDIDDDSTDQNIYATVLTASSDTFTKGTRALMNSVKSRYMASYYDTEQNKSVVPYQIYNSSASDYYGKIGVIAISETTPSWTDSTNTLGNTTSDRAKPQASLFNPDTNKGVVIADRQTNNEGVSALLSFGSTTSTVVNGSVFAGTALSATALELKTFPASTIVGKADGAVTKGKPLIVEADGDFAEVKNITASGSFSNGTLTSLNGASNDRYGHLNYNILRDKFLFQVRDNSIATLLGMAVTVSNDTVTVGASSSSPLTNPANNKISNTVCFDESTSYHAVFAKNSNNLEGATAAINSSGAVLWGSKVNFYSTILDSICCNYVNDDNVSLIFYSKSSETLCNSITTTGGSIASVSSITIDSNYTPYGMSSAYSTKDNKTVLVRQDNGSSNYFSYCVVTSSGTGATLSTSTPTVFVSNANRVSNQALAYDITNDKFLLVYKENSSNKLTLQVGTLSGTTVAWGSATYLSGNPLTTSADQSISYNKFAGKFLVNYLDDSNSSYTTAFEVTLDSNGTITIENKTVLYSYNSYDNSGASSTISAQNIVSTYGTSNYSKGIGVSSSYSTSETNLTTENYIGIAQETVSTGNDVKVTTISGVNANQSSLTPAQLYYVQTDGTLSTTAGSPSVVAGLATSATTLLVTRS